jgi:hypothetical protein
MIGMQLLHQKPEIEPGRAAADADDFHRLLLPGIKPLPKIN